MLAFQVLRLTLPLLAVYVNYSISFAYMFTVQIDSFVCIQAVVILGMYAVNGDLNVCYENSEQSIGYINDICLHQRKILYKSKRRAVSLIWL